MKTKNLQTNLIRQNVFILDMCNSNDLHSSDESMVYESIDEIVSSDGLKHVRSFVPYEITADYVNSFADSVDYRKDPVSAIVNAPKRQSLGDIRDFQKVANMDDSQAQMLFKQLQERFSSQNPVSSDKPPVDKPPVDKPPVDNPPV